MSSLPSRPRLRTKLQRALGVLLALLLVGQTAPSALAKAEDKPANAELVNWWRKHHNQQPARAEEKPGHAEGRKSEPAAQDKAATPEKKSRGARGPKASAGKDPAVLEARRRGTVALNTGHYEDAIKAFEEAYALDQDPNLLFGLAQAYRLAGQPGKALEACGSYLRTAGPSKTDRLQAERFLGEVAMIVYQLQVQRDSAQAHATAPPPAPAAIPAAVEPPSEARAAKHEPEVVFEKPIVRGLEPPPLDLTPRPPAEPTAVLTTNPTPAEPKAPRHFYQSTVFWVVVGAAVVTGGGLGLWAYERSLGLHSPNTSLGYQPAFP